MEITQVRSATIIVKYDNTKFLIDPWLAPKESMAGFDGAINSNIRQPRVELPFEIEKVVDVDAVIITHVHDDHWDEYAENALNKDIKLFVQSETDKNYVEQKGFTNVEIISETGTKYEGITLYKTQGQHGKREIVKPIWETINIPYDTMGVVFKAENEKTLYIAGDTIWCEEVEDAINSYNPDVIIVNSCAATMLNGERIIMNDEDVKEVLKAAPNTKVIASHMDTVSHLSITRQDLKKFVDENNVDNLLIPDDGETLYFPSEKETRKNKLIARKFYELIANKEYDEAKKLCSDDFVYYPQVDICLKGADKFIELESSNMNPFGDFKMRTKFIIADNDRVAVYLTFEGDLLSEEWHGVKVSNKHSYIDFMTMLKFRDGKIVEKRAKYDRYFIYKQLGVKQL